MLFSCAETFSRGTNDLAFQFERPVGIAMIAHLCEWQRKIIINQRAKANTQMHLK